MPDSAKTMTPEESTARIEEIQLIIKQADTYPNDIQFAIRRDKALRRYGQWLLDTIDESKREIEDLKADKEATMFKASVCDKWEGFVNDRNNLLQQPADAAAREAELKDLVEQACVSRDHWKAERDQLAAEVERLKAFITRRSGDSTFEEWSTGLDPTERHPFEIINDMRVVLAEHAERLGKLREALNRIKKQLAVGRRFLPSHGSFGEEGINNYQCAQRDVDNCLALLDSITKPCTATSIDSTGATHVAEPKPEAPAEPAAERTIRELREMLTKAQRFVAPLGGMADILGKGFCSEAMATFNDISIVLADNYTHTIAATGKEEKSNV